MNYFDLSLGELGRCRRSVALVLLELFSHVIDEPFVSAAAPGDVTLPGCDDVVDNCVRTQVLIELFSVSEWASIVKEADIHGYVDLLNPAIVHELSLNKAFWVSCIIEPVMSVFLEALSVGCLCIGSHSLDWVVFKVLIRWD